ncbi:hypothetical protein PIB30_096031 [Stylosanthes scabra]|uniref:Uncharacterized protein n=1 Tax=Stylosanthes scabra TaxID=79078 RepID=A0ABU6YU55_9FABA|nr:hypothetical protein [Stylosanthes scabra]
MADVSVLKNVGESGNKPFGSCALMMGGRRENSFHYSLSSFIHSSEGIFPVQLHRCSFFVSESIRSSLAHHFPGISRNGRESAGESGGGGSRGGGGSNSS